MAKFSSANVSSKLLPTKPQLDYVSKLLKSHPSLTPPDTSSRASVSLWLDQVTKDLYDPSRVIEMAGIGYSDLIDVVGSSENVGMFSGLI